MGVRSLASEDMPALARLFQKVFQRRDTPASSALETYLAELYLPQEGSDGAIESKVYVTDKGALIGFCGVNEVPMTVNGRPIRGALCSSLMVDPTQADAMVAGRLMRTVRQGAQDFTYSETASEASVTMWKSLRGSVLPLHSLDWLRVFLPLQFSLDLVRQRLPAFGVMAPLVAPIDRLIRKGEAAPAAWRLRPVQTKTWLEERDLGVAETADLIRHFAAGYRLTPAWPNGALEQRVEDAARKSQLGPMTSRAVINAKGDTIGLFIYHGRSGRVGRVLQLLAAPGQAGVVLDRLFAHADAAGIVAMRGRSDPALLDAARGRELLLTTRASTVVDSQDPEILEALQNGGALLHGLAGETWSRLHYDAWDDLV